MTRSPVSADPSDLMVRVQTYRVQFETGYHQTPSANDIVTIKSRFFSLLDLFQPGSLLAVAGRWGSKVEYLINALEQEKLDSHGTPIRVQRLDWTEPHLQRSDTHQKTLENCRHWTIENKGIAILEGCVHRRVEHRGNSIEAFRPGWSDLPRGLARQCDGVIFIFHRWYYQPEVHPECQLEIYAQARLSNNTTVKSPCNNSSTPPRKDS